jgi:cyclin C
MAGNFWQSSHFQQWLFDRQQLLLDREADLKILTEDEYQKLMIFFAGVITDIGIQLRLRQQVIATAITYMKRFFLGNGLKSVDGWLLAPACVFLASKVEEFGVIPNTRLMSVTMQTGLFMPYGMLFQLSDHSTSDCFSAIGLITIQLLAHE